MLLTEYPILLKVHTILYHINRPKLVSRYNDHFIEVKIYSFETTIMRWLSCRVVTIYTVFHCSRNIIMMMLIVMQNTQPREMY